MKIKINDHVMTDNPMKEAPAVEVIIGPSSEVSVLKSKVSVVNESIKIPMRNPKSAKRVTIKAFFEAATADGFS
jgi:hypothetical protein